MENLRDLTGVVYDKKRYKPCRRNRYNAWLCKPDIGTCIVDVVGSSRLVSCILSCEGIDNTSAKILKETGIVSKKLLRLLKSNQPNIYSALAKESVVISTPIQYLVKGSSGEILIIDYHTLRSNYSIFNGTEYVDVTKELLTANAKRTKSGFVMDWVRIRYNNNKTEYMALHIPVGIKGCFNDRSGNTYYVNTLGKCEGNGDIVLCGNFEGSPDFSNLAVIKGEIFKNTFDNRGWTKIVGTPKDFSEVPRPVSIFNLYTPKSPKSDIKQNLANTHRGNGDTKIMNEFLSNYDKNENVSKLGNYISDVASAKLNKLAEYLFLVVNDCAEENWHFKYSETVIGSNDNTSFVVLQGRYKTTLNKDVLVKFNLMVHFDGSMSIIAKGADKVGIKNTLDFESIRPCMYKAVLGGELSEYFDESGNSKLLTR